ncbi:hypothetical protein L366_04483 [Klebsiella variicola]|nr:hypothetical protein L366_04483 [Klebsiella variicola]
MYTWFCDEGHETKTLNKKIRRGEHHENQTTVAALSILSVVSFGAFAADVINSEQAQGREAIGTVSVGAVASSPMDMHEMLNKKAQEEGASSYRIIEARTGDHWHATAELYK